MTEKIMWELPLTTVSEANSSEHWSKSSKRHRQQQFFVRAMFHARKPAIPIPCKITLTRLNSRALDDDNNVSAMKWIRDEISECIFPEKRKVIVTSKGKLRPVKGRADDDPRLHWEYAQEKSKTLGIRIEIAPYNAEIAAIKPLEKPEQLVSVNKSPSNSPEIPDNFGKTKNKFTLLKNIK